MAAGLTPDGRGPHAANFRLEQVAVPDLADGQVLVRHYFLSLDPYMRGRMNESKSYAQPQPLDSVMIGGTAGEVVASRNPHFAVGDKVVGMGGWQEYAIVDASQRRRAAEGGHDAHPAVGLPRCGGHAGCHGLDGPDADHRAQGRRDRGGERGVGRRGRRAGPAGAPARLSRRGHCRRPGQCRYVVEELGFDACIDYKQHADLKSLTRALKEACPNGIDGHFENVGGMILDAVMLRTNAFARIAVCGMIAGYDGAPLPMANPALILVNRMKIQGFIVSERMELWPQALKELGTLVGTGKLKYRESVAEGIASAPEAFLGLLKGRNFGKQLVRLA